MAFPGRCPAVSGTKVFRPVGASDALFGQALKGRNSIAQGNALGPRQIKSAKPCRDAIMQVHYGKAAGGPLFHVSSRGPVQREREDKSSPVGDGFVEAKVSSHLSSEAPTQRQSEADAGFRVRGVLSGSRERTKQTASQWGWDAGASVTHSQRNGLVVASSL